jgi:hypothetical protein
VRFYRRHPRQTASALQKGLTDWRVRIMDDVLQCWFKHEAPPTALQAGAPAFVPPAARPSSASDAVMASPVGSTPYLPAPAIEEDDVGTCNICFEPPFKFGLLGESNTT